MSECNCGEHECAVACEERMPSLLESMKEVLPYLFFGKFRSHCQVSHCQVVAAFILSEIRRMESKSTVNELAIKEIADAVLVPHEICASELADEVSF